MVLQLFLCRRIPLPKVQRSLPGHALLLTVRCQHKIPAVPIHRQEWLSLYLSLQTSTVPNRHTTSGFLILPPFIPPSIYLLSIPGKVTSARTFLALLPGFLVVLPFFTWDMCTFQLKVKPQGYPEPSYSRPLGKWINQVLKSGQGFFLLAWEVTPGAYRSYAEVVGADAMWIVMFPGHQHLEAWGAPHANGVCSRLFNKQMKKPMLVFREAKQVMWGLQHVLWGIFEHCFGFVWVFVVFFFFPSFSSLLTPAPLCSVPGLSPFASQGKQWCCCEASCSIWEKLSVIAKDNFFPFSLRQKMLAMWKFGFAVIHILFES